MEDLRSNLEAFGFSPNESKVLLSLMKGNTMTAAEIAEDAGIPRPSVYEILKSFTEKGFCNEIETPTKLWYELIDPEIVEDKLEKELNRNYKSRLGSLKGSFSSLKSLYKSSEPAKKNLSIELLRGFNKHRNLKFNQIVKDAKNEVLLMNRLEGVISTDQNEMIEYFINNGGTVKTLYELSTNFKIKINDKWQEVTNEDLYKICEADEKVGVKVKLMNIIPQNMLIVDRQIVFLNIVEETGDKPVKSDLIIRNHKYASMMADAFDMYWEKSKTVKELRNGK